MQKTLAILIIFVLFFVSCSKKAVRPVDNPGSLYVDGVELIKKKKYDDAIANFAKIRENFPFDPIAVVAQVKQGDAYFAKKEYQLAANTYEDFFNSYPDDENAAYAMKRAGECYEKQSPTLDRDQAITVKAVERFTFLKNRYPSSPYAQDADSHIRDLNRKLGARELYVGEFYYKSGSYNASILRLEYFLRSYPEADQRDKALHYLAEDYKELSRPDKEQYYLDMLRKEFPKSIYTKSARKSGRPVSLIATATAVAPVETAASETKKTAVKPVSAAATTIEEPKAEKTVSPSSYEEKKKRNIDLRPPEAALPAATKVNEADTQEEPLPKTVDGGDAGQTGTGDKGEPKPELVAAAEAKSAGGNEAGGPKDKKNSLGFFTEKKPVDVVADTMEAFEKGKTIVFKGNVVAKQEGSEPGQTLFLFSDRLTAYRADESSDIQKAEAEGNVRIVKAQRTATCKRAFFYNDRGEVVLKGEVVVFEGNDRLTGDTATYYLNEDRVYVQGDKEKRARVIVTPKK
jgi:outer membrane protein assembly factor BamD